jgi:hypothetical protein
VLANGFLDFHQDFENFVGESEAYEQAHHHHQQERDEHFAPSIGIPFTAATLGANSR